MLNKAELISMMVDGQTISESYRSTRNLKSDKIIICWSALLVSVPVTAGQNLILAAAVQSVGRAMFNIQATMVGCSHHRHHPLSENTVEEEIFESDHLLSRQSSLRVGQHQISAPVLPGPGRL